MTLPAEMIFPLENVAGRVAHIAPFHVMELIKMAAVLEQQGRSIIHMGIGEPDFTAAPAVIAAATRASGVALAARQFRPGNDAGALLLAGLDGAEAALAHVIYLG